MPSVSPQKALIDCAIFAATVPAAVALVLGSVWGPPDGAIVVMAHCGALPNAERLRVAADCMLGVEGPLQPSIIWLLKSVSRLNAKP